MSGFVTALNNMFNGAPAPAPTVTPQAPGLPGEKNPAAAEGTMGDMSSPNGPAPNTNTGTDPNNNNQSKGNAGDVDLSKIWDTSTTATAPEAGYLPKMDPAKLRESFSKLNFVGDVSAEQLAAVQAGGPEGVQAMLAIVNQSSRSVAERLFSANYGLLDKTLPGAFDKYSGTLDSKITSHLSSNALGALNPVMRDPQYKPTVDGIRDKIAEKNPHLTADQLTSATSRYFNQMAESMGFTKKAVEVPDTPNTNSGRKQFGKAPDADWEEWAGLKLP